MSHKRLSPLPWNEREHRIFFIMRIVLEVNSGHESFEKPTREDRYVDMRSLQPRIRSPHAARSDRFKNTGPVFPKSKPSESAKRRVRAARAIRLPVMSRAIRLPDFDNGVRYRNAIAIENAASQANVFAFAIVFCQTGDRPVICKP